MKRLGQPPFTCLITQGVINIDNFRTEKLALSDTIRDAVADGVNVVQIRERKLSVRLLFDLAREVVEAVRAFDAVVLINDRADVAIAAGADGVHLRESSLSPAVVRSAFSKEFIVGVSSHSTQTASSAAAAGADFVFFGPIFESPGKGSPTGTTELKNICQTLREFPVIALGGIDSRNVGQVLDAGVAGIAAIRSLHDADERRRIMRSINLRSTRVR